MGGGGVEVEPREALQAGGRGGGAVLAVGEAGTALQRGNVEEVAIGAEVAGVVVERVPEQALVAQHLPSAVVCEGVPAGEAAQNGAGQALRLCSLGGGVVEVVDGAEVEVDC